ncbi:MAG: protein-L-isoaspartate(D-aspartate) O-methyltransferase [Deltaproteobacteria bacterium]|nr:protein-L-isoaspartate(D-aspartate) O-methyltransferase [Deltaproteobacteria bacterium]
MNTTTLSSGPILNKILLAAGVLSLLLFFSYLSPARPWGGGQGEEDAVAGARRAMVENDLRSRGIKDPKVLEAMSQVPRHLFVMEKHRSSAYEDRPLPIGKGQTISQPYVVALMTELLELKGGEKVLEIGTGSGYQAAVLSHLAKEVYTIEIVPALAEKAGAVLARLGYSNVGVKVGDGFFGWPEMSPFDAILVTASAQKVPEPLWRQLREAGRLVMPLGGEHQSQRLIRIRKRGGRQEVENITGVLFVPMTGTIQKEAR